MLSAVITGVTDGATFGLMALGIVLVYKATRVINFAQGEIGTVAIYLAWMATSRPGTTLAQIGPFSFGGLGLPLVFAVTLAVLLAAGLGVAMERLVVRPMSDAAPLTITVATLGVSTVLGGLELIIWGERPQNLPSLLSGQAVGIGGIFVDRGRLLALAVTVVLGVVFYVFFKRSTFGLGVLAASQNPTSLRLMGIRLSVVSMFTWGVAGVLAALAGIILAPTIGSFHPYFMTLILIPSFAAALVGGLTSLPGAFVGGMVVGVVTSLSKYVASRYLKQDIPGLQFVAQFALIVGVLTLRPRGLLGGEA
ncbi:MAG TPA: branched-chain amino acid ABC transporter permease [Actinomycetota bacterium]|nr:branched-chain amino acid ABC transporter permease [Actinomycetota bacterium]